MSSSFEAVSMSMSISICLFSLTVSLSIISISISICLSLSMSTATSTSAGTVTPVLGQVTHCLTHMCVSYKIEPCLLFTRPHLMCSSSQLWKVGIARDTLQMKRGLKEAKLPYLTCGFLQGQVWALAPVVPLTPECAYSVLSLCWKHGFG